MATFQYEALDTKTGKTEKGEMPANSQAEALSRLQEMGLAPTKVEEAKGASGAKKKKKRAGGKKKGKKSALDIQIGTGVNEKSLTIFTRQLAQLTSAGLPLLSGLTVLERQEKNPGLKRVCAELAEVIEGGGTFSEGLAQHPKVFNKLFVSMVKAGELGGVLEVVLDRLAQFMEKAARIKGKVKAAMFYPIAVLIVAIVIMGILLVFVIPKFKEVFADLTGEGGGLHWFTELVLSISNTVKTNVFGTLTGMFAFFLTLSFLGKTKYGRFVLDKLALFFPVVGPVVEKVSIARFARTLGTLINSGVPILQALNIVKDTSGNTVIATAVQDVHDSVKEGETIVAPLEASRVFPPMVISMVDVGEKTGDMPQMLEKIADTYDEEVDRSVEAMTSLIEPIMICFLAVIVGSIVIAMFLPLIQMIDTMGGD
ncbi:MAG: pilus assembly protein PilC [Verrucomicrobiales bacterium]|nr:pilus assembly protein PilC [Verrucomicrobiales bacterium]MBE87585.1 pilus assembly protein PilC [Verrucomicrobiales bacterium]